MSPPTLYYALASPSCRSVLMGAKAIGVDLTLKIVNLGKNEHKDPSYLKMNRQHTIPVLDDNGFYLSESRVILSYLADRYAKDDSLYPRDVQKRAIVDHRMHFDLGTLTRRGQFILTQEIWLKKKADEMAFKRLDESIDWLDSFLAETKWVAGDQMTIADCSLVAGITTTALSLPKVNFAKKNILRWLVQCKEEMPGYSEYNERGLKHYKKIFLQGNVP